MWTNKFKRNPALNTEAVNEAADSAASGDYLAHGKILDSHADAKEALRVDAEVNLEVESFAGFIMDERGAGWDAPALTADEIDNKPDHELTPQQLEEKKKRKGLSGEDLAAMQTEKSEIESLIDQIVKALLQAQTNDPSQQAAKQAELMEALQAILKGKGMNPELLQALQAGIAEQLGAALAAQIEMGGLNAMMQNLMQLQQQLIQALQGMDPSMQGLNAAIQLAMMQAMQQNMAALNPTMQGMLVGLQQQMLQAMQGMDPSLQGMLATMQLQAMQATQAMMGMDPALMGMLAVMQQNMTQSMQQQGMDPSQMAMLQSLQAQLQATQQAAINSQLQSQLSQQAALQSQIQPDLQAQLQSQLQSQLAQQQAQLQSQLAQQQAQIAQQQMAQQPAIDAAMMAQQQQAVMQQSQNPALLGIQSQSAIDAANWATQQQASEKQLYKATEQKDPLSSLACGGCGACSQCLGGDKLHTQHSNDIHEMLGVRPAEIQAQTQEKQLYKATEQKDPLSSLACGGCGACSQCLGGDKLQTQHSNDIHEMLGARVANSNSAPSLAPEKVDMTAVQQQQAMMAQR